MFAAVIVAAIAVLLWVNRSEPEPQYEGRTLSQWVDSLQPANPTAEATNAICQIGTNALPYLLRWMSYDPSKFRNQLLRLVFKLPGRPPRFLALPAVRSANAEFALGILGANARPAIPRLVELAITSRGDSRCVISVRSIARIGRDALPLLMVATNREARPATRYLAIHALATECTNGESAVAALVPTLDDSDPDVAAQAAYAMSMFPLDSPLPVVPALIAKLQSTNPELRGFAVAGLGSYGTRAASAVPILKPMLLDTSHSVREEVTNALLRIAPGVLTNAPSG